MDRTWPASPRSPLLEGGATRGQGNDAMTALGKQIRSIIEHLCTASRSRAVRVDDGLNVLRDTLFTHSEEIGSSDQLQHIMLCALDAVFDVDVERGCRAFEVIFDFTWKDQHEKRSRCLDLLLRRALRATRIEDCRVILRCITEVLEDNIRTTTEILLDSLQFLFETVTDAGADDYKRALCFEVLSCVVVTTAAVIKRNPTLLDYLTTSSPPLPLLRQIVESASPTYRFALVRFLNVMVEQNCYEFAPAMINQIVDAVHHYMQNVTQENQLVGVLFIMDGIVASSMFVNAAWDMAAICRFLTERDWSVFALDTRCAAVATTGKMSYLLLSDDVVLHDVLARRFVWYIAHDPDELVVACALRLLCVLLQRELLLRDIDQYVQALRLCITQQRCVALAFETLQLVRRRYGEAAVETIYTLIEDAMRRKSLNELQLSTLDAVLRFIASSATMGTTTLSRPDGAGGLDDLCINLSDTTGGGDGARNGSCTSDRGGGDACVPREKGSAEGGVTSVTTCLVQSLSLVATLERTGRLAEVVRLMFHPNADVREAAARAVVALCRVILRRAAEAQERRASSAGGGVNGSFGGGGVGSNNSNNIETSSRRLDSRVADAVERLLDVAVADRQPRIRLVALQLLCPSLDPYLCLPDNLEALFMTWNDVERDVRDAALVLICRLHPLHPAFVHPQLLRVQDNMLRDLDTQSATLSRTIDKARSLRVCAEHDSLVLKPFAVEEVVLRNLQQSRQSSFASKALTVVQLQLLQSILEHADQEHHCEVAHFVGPVLEIIGDNDSSLCRLAALDTLRAILTTLTVQEPSLTYAVYRSIARILRWEAREEESVTIAAMRVAGTVGAVNPVKIRWILRGLESDEVEEEEVAVTAALTHFRPRLRISPGLVNRYPFVVLYYLIKALQLTIDPRQQVEALTTVRTMLQGLPSKPRMELLTQLLPQLQAWLLEPGKFHLYEKVLGVMTDMTGLLRQYSEETRLRWGLQLIQSAQHFCALPQAAQKPLNALVVQFLDALAKCLPPHEMRTHRWAVEFIHQRLSQNEKDLNLVQRVVQSLESFLAVMDEKDVQLILPHVLQCMEPTQTDKIDVAATAVNDACFDFLNSVIARDLPMLKDCCAHILDTIMWFVELSVAAKEVDTGLHTMAALIHRVGKPARRFIAPIERIASTKGYAADHFRELTTQAAGVEGKTTSSTRGGVMTEGGDGGVNNTGSSGSSPTTTTTGDGTEQQVICFISSLPQLTRAEFEVEVHRTLRGTPATIEVVAVTNRGGQSVVLFRVLPGPNQAAAVSLLLRKAQDANSSLRRNLGIGKVEQNVEVPRPVDRAILAAIATIPSPKSKKREQSWISWLHNTAVRLLRQSPYAALRCTATAADRNNELALDLFPFAATAVLEQLELDDRQVLMEVLSGAVEKAPYDIKQVLFILAEFMEAERVEPKVVVVKKVQQKTFVVVRETVTQKFGISYDQDPTRGVVVTRLAPNGLGAAAGVPVGAQLLLINNQPVRCVSDIRGLIEGLLRIELTVAFVEEVRQRAAAKPLMSLDTLARVAFFSQMHAKAIYFNEVAFSQLFAQISADDERGEDDGDGGGVAGQARNDGLVHGALGAAERLIEFYGHLNLSMEASGLVSMLRRRFDDFNTPGKFGFDEVGTLEQLHWWREALSLYEARMVNPDTGMLDVDAFAGAMRCQEAMGHIDMMRDMVDRCWTSLDEEAQLKLVPHRAKAALALGAWQDFDALAARPAFVEQLGVVEHCAAHFRLGQYDELLLFTQARREALLEPFAESFNENYNRSYDTLVELQHLTHFEELVSFVHSSGERRMMLKRLWQTRLSQMSAKPAHIIALIAINSLVLSPREDLQSHVVAIRALTKVQWYSMAEHLLTALMGGPCTSVEELCRQEPELIHAYMKYLCARKASGEPYDLLRGVLHEVHVTPQDRGAEAWSWCWLLLGELTISLFPDRGDEAVSELRHATTLSPRNQAAFHSLGILHYDLARLPSTAPGGRNEHCVAAVTAFFNSVQLCGDRTSGTMQDVVRILSIWFAHSQLEELNCAVQGGVQMLASHVWLNVVPQLIARIGITAMRARKILTELLVRVGIDYPQALIYPLTVAEKSPDPIRGLMARQVLSGIRLSNSQIVDEASLISNEMVRIAILSAEKWHAAIHEAAQRQDNAVAILKILRPLFDELDHATTPNERNFDKLFGQTLKRARTALEAGTLDSAWSFLKQVYAPLDKMLGERRLNMGDISPTLDTVEHSIVAVPGTFEHNKPLVTIERFRPYVYIMPSKQKPRRFGLDASDGKKYHFLLKGHEDMRQDERVMQFIGLVNGIFAAESATSAIALSIPQYAVIPLSENVGIVGWVENSETIYKLLETYRYENGTSIYEEVTMILKKGELRNIEDYHRLPKQQRKELLQYVMQHTPDDELGRIMWEQNDSCEQWLTYRATYGHTLAAMSMVGYVLGLGDRHLNNLMLEASGMVVHIDFGDCFEVAMLRALYAEAVPFRLTRLLVRALGITGVDGVFRATSEQVMKYMRKHSENLLSLLEAFIYDPLLNWRLTSNENDRSTSQADGIEAATAPAPNGRGAQLTTETGSVTRRGILDDVITPPAVESSMQLSHTYAKQYITHNVSTLPVDEAEGEKRNQQGDVALARVKSKLTGQDFDPIGSSFAMLRNSRLMDANGRAVNGGDYGWNANTDMLLAESLKDSIDATLLTTYLTRVANADDRNGPDVARQVDRLIQEAVNLDNLADAYLTGWAPFW